MNKIPPSRSLLAAAAASAAVLLGGADAARAVELVTGGYGIDPAAALAGDAPAAPGSDPGGASWTVGADGSSVVLGFTPRGSGAFGAGRGAGDAPKLRFELGVAAGPGGWDAGAVAGDRPSWLAGDDPAAGLGELSVGGALRWSEWSLGGGYARTALLGGEADLFSATVGRGAWSATLGLGEAEAAGRDAPPLDVLTLSADFAAWSWLSLGSDVAVGSGDEAESVAVGRLGVRLNF
jgi:hypothetical protein